MRDGASTPARPSPGGRNVDELHTRARCGRPTAAAIVGLATAILLGVTTLASATPAMAKGATTTSDSAKVRFVNMAVTSDYPDGTPVDVYAATTVTARPDNGGKITAVKPAPKKFVPKLAFGGATKYLSAPVGTLFFVTSAGKPDILGMGAVEAAANAHGVADTYEITTNGPPVLADEASTTTTKGFGYTSPLSVGAYNEQTDFTYTDGTGRPIKDAAVLFTHTTGITSGTSDSEWQMGVVGKGCLPEFLTNGNEDSDFNPEYLAPESGTGRGIEYVASEPGALELGLWSGATTDCSGSPVVSATANVAAGTRSYLYWYGPASEPKLLVLSLATPKGEKSATNSSPSAYTGSGSSSGDSTDSGDSSSTTTSSTSTTTP